MEKRGQIPAKIVVSIFISIALFMLALYFLINVRDVKEQYETAEIINLKTSIQTRVLQQSAKPKESVSNVSISVPAGVERVCFLDSNKEYDRFRNPEISELFSDDKINNLFLLSDEGFFSYRIDKLDIHAKNNPMCMRIDDGKINLQLISKGSSVEARASLVTQDVDCVSVYENGEPERKIDVVFLGYGFSNLNKYGDEVNRYVNDILLEFAPFNEYKDKFNFYRVDNADIYCDIGGFIDCNKYQINLAASNCPHDFIVLLVDRSAVSDLLSPVRSSAVGNIAKINTADKPFVLVHEFGHSFADLADEYVDENYYDESNFNVNQYVNCDTAPCPSWQGTEDAECYQGCSLGKYFRPTEDSIMKTLNSPDFGPVNENEILLRLLYYE